MNFFEKNMKPEFPKYVSYFSDDDLRTPNPQNGHSDTEYQQFDEKRSSCLEKEIF